ncbi:MAG: DUF1631 domain-containing protein [Xanthomonadales bacterium]|nr:DUF1631 domain-containing protein [Xanthomonadales bacterium]
MSQQGNEPPGKVVDLHSRGTTGTGNSGSNNPPVPAERGGELVRTCRRIAQKRLAQGLTGMFDKVDDALFDMAEKAENSTKQAALFDGMREVRRKRPIMEKHFQDGLAKALTDFSLKSGKSDNASSDGLSLVAEEDLEEDLAISAMVGKAENQLSRPLFALENRLAVVFGGSKIDNSTNPVGPAAVCEAFRVAMADLESDITVRLLILKLFEKHTLAGLEGLYEELNLTLIEAGVLPHLKHATRSPNAHPSAPPAGYSRGAIDPDAPPTVPPGMDGGMMAGPAMGAAAMPGMPMAGGSYSGEALLQMEILNTLRGLLASRRQQYGPAVPAGPSFATTDVLNALSVLQSQNVGAPATSGGIFGYAGSGPFIPLSELKHEITEKLAHLGTDTEGHRMAAADEDTIDLVGMLFEFILQDRNLPSQVQALLARLQIPYLKAAILDKELFARPDHSARQLLDELANLGLGWSEEADRDGRIFAKIREIVESLLKEFDDDVGLFQRMLDNLAEFNRGQQRRAEVAEQRTAETTKGKEKLHAARKSAAREILQRIEEKALPEVIRNLLTRPWANVIVLTILRQGENSHQWRTSLRIADELVWAAAPKASDAERTRLRALIPELEKALRQGLSMVAYHEHDIEQLLGELRSFFDLQLDPQADPSTMLREPKPLGEPEPAPPSGDTEAAAPAAADGDVAETETVGTDGSTSSVRAEAPAVAPAPPPPPAPPQEESFVEEIAREAVREGTEESDEPELIEDEHYRAAREIKVGTWVEFRAEADRVERAKLSWISPISAKYLFVNRKGLKVADKTVLGLAHELRQGRAMILEDVPLFDRALDAIVERLKSGVPADDSENRS